MRTRPRREIADVTTEKGTLSKLNQYVQSAQEMFFTRF